MLTIIVVVPDKFDTFVEDSERRFDGLPSGEDFLVDQCSEHLSFNKSRKERQLLLGLVRQKSGLVEVLHRLSTAQPLVHVLF